MHMYIVYDVTNAWCITLLVNSDTVLKCKCMDGPCHAANSICHDVAENESLDASL